MLCLFAFLRSTFLKLAYKIPIKVTAIYFLSKYKLKHFG
jgi:hypothetical protein